MTTVTIPALPDVLKGVTVGDVKDGLDQLTALIDDVKAAVASKGHFDQDVQVVQDLLGLIGMVPIPEVQNATKALQIGLAVVQFAVDNGVPAQPEDPAMKRATGPAEGFGLPPTEGISTGG